MSNSNNNKLSKTRGRSHSIIRGGSGKVLYDSVNDDRAGKSSSVIYSGDKKRILYEDKGKGANDKE
jgi:hypothetical protein